MIVLAIAAISLPALAAAFILGSTIDDLVDIFVAFAATVVVVGCIAWGSAYLAHHGVW